MAQQVENPITITIQRASQLSGLSVASLRRHLASGHLEYTQPCRRILVSFESLQTFLKEGVEKPIPQPPAAALRAPAPIPVRAPEPNIAAMMERIGGRRRRG